MLLTRAASKRILPESGALRVGRWQWNQPAAADSPRWSTMGPSSSLLLVAALLSVSPSSCLASSWQENVRPITSIPLGESSSGHCSTAEEKRRCRAQEPSHLPMSQMLSKASEPATPRGRFEKHVSLRVHLNSEREREKSLEVIRFAPFLAVLRLFHYRKSAGLKDGRLLKARPFLHRETLTLHNSIV